MQLHDAPLDVDVLRVDQGEVDGAEVAQGGGLAAVFQRDDVVEVAGRRLHQRDQHPPALGRLGVLDGFDRLVVDHGGPQLGARGQFDFEELLGGVVHVEGGGRPIGPVGVEDQHGFGQADAGPHHLDVARAGRSGSSAPAAWRRRRPA